MVLNAVFASVEVGGVRRNKVIGLDRIEAVVARLIAGAYDDSHPVNMGTKPAMVRARRGQDRVLRNGWL